MSLPEDDPESDAVLIERVRRGDPEAFHGIVDRYRRDIYRIGYRMTGTHQDADDVTQETFIRAYGALPSFRGDAALKTWLTRIALNLSVSSGRARTARREEALETTGGDLSRQLGRQATAEASVLAEERQRAVRGAVDRLPPKQRQVVILRMYEGLQFREIAALIDAPVGTVKANFFHAVQNLRKVLE